MKGSQECRNAPNFCRRTITQMHLRREPTLLGAPRQWTIDRVDREFTLASPIPRDRSGQREQLAMKTTILAYVIALGGLAMLIFGLWGLYNLDHGKGR